MTDRRITRSLLAAVAIFGLTTACGGDSDTNDATTETTATEAATPATVDIEGFAFAPATLEIEAGTTVTWTNQDGFAHSVIADDKAFSSEELAKGASYEETFDEAGTYAYFCGIHNSMRGVIEVA